MSSRIKLTSDEMRMIALFESITGATVRDCIIDPPAERVIFVVKTGDIGQAIGRDGHNVRTIRGMVGKNVEIIEYSDQPSTFLRNALSPARIKEVRVTEKSDGRRIAVIAVEPRDKGFAIGKNGKTAERTRFLAKRYFQIDNVIIT